MNKDLDLISIIIPTLNEENYVGKLLNCLVNQTYKNFEVIVVDGHSDDKTKEVVNRFKKKLDLKLVNSKRRNVAHQRNLGAKKSKFERLLFLDADTIMDRNFLNQLKTSDVIFGSVSILPYKAHWYDKLFFSIINKTFFLLQYIKPYSLGACIISNKSLHKKVNGFNEGLKFCEEFDYVYKGSKIDKFRFKYDNKILTSTRRFEEKGTKKTIKLWLISFFYNLFTNKYLGVNYFHDRLG